MIGIAFRPFDISIGTVPVNEIIFRLEELRPVGIFLEVFWQMVVMGTQIVDYIDLEGVLVVVSISLLIHSQGMA